MAGDNANIGRDLARAQRPLVLLVALLTALTALTVLPWLGVGYCIFVGGSACPAFLSPQIAQGPGGALSGRETQTVQRVPVVMPPSGTSGSVLVSTAGNLPTANPKYVALVIGNSDYKSPNKPLKNPKNDANAIAAALKKLNYTLIGGGAQLDLSYDVMRRAVIAFKTATAGAEVGLIYYAGHGIQIDDKEPIYLVPTDAKLLKKEELEIEGVPLSFVTAALPNRVLPGGVEQVGIVILDACRTSNYPLEGLEAAKRGTGQRGLKVVKAPKRSLIAFSATAGEPASDGNEGDTNSPYAQSLLKHLDDRDRPDFKALFDRIDRDFEENGEHQTPVKDDKLATRRIPVGTSERPPPVGTKKRDCDVCPEMVVLPKGTFLMGAPKSEEGSTDDQRPQRQVTVESFAIGTHEVTFREWDACVADGGCTHKAHDQEWGRDDRPVVDVNWDDAQRYVKWLSVRTYNMYRLPTETEWEYAARAGTTTPYPWGAKQSRDFANYAGTGGRDKWENESAPVGQFPANKFGLFDMHGNVGEWVEDCWNWSYNGAPADGRARLAGNCSLRVLRGGSWSADPRYIRSASRSWNDSTVRFFSDGFRVARTL